MPAQSPTDANGYLGPSLTKGSIPPMYPMWMVHPTLDSVIVADSPSQAIIVATDPAWVPSTPAVLAAGVDKQKRDKK
jgi:hypothetical protein